MLTHADDLTKSQAEQEIDRLVESFRDDLGRLAVLIAKNAGRETLTQRDVARAATRMLDFGCMGEQSMFFGVSDLLAD